MSNESIPDQLIHTTVRLETTNLDGIRGSGTGSIMQICKTDDHHIPVIVTNWHVVEGAKSMSFCMTVADNNGKPKFGTYESVTMDSPETMWARHPNYPAVDLAVLPIAPVLEMFSNKGAKPYFRAFDPEFVADEKYIADLVAIEDVIMIGYPTGLWDDHNNLPMVRRGITATPPAIPFKNKAEFVIDCACYPGSSGSPVILYSMGGHIVKGGGMMLGSGRVKLIGVLYAGPRYTAQGEIQVVPVPTAVRAVSLSPLHINLGYCIRASELAAFDKLFAPIAEAERKVREGKLAARAVNDNLAAAS